MNVSSSYRPDIDGLRAVAVLAVIIYHIDPLALSGGYLGVDIFFVISGYLITSIILAQLHQGSFRLVEFYSRRVRRIIPALGVVVLCSFIAAWFSMDATQFESFAASAIAQSFFAANVYFWEHSGYFSSTAELQPLLHTWSLAVEEQYYLIFPVVASLTFRLGVRWFVCLLALATTVSLCFAHWSSATSPDAAFFLLPARLWELGAGACIATLNHLRRDKHFGGGDKYAWIASASGLLLIAISMVSFDASTRHPSAFTVPLVLGTCLIVWKRSFVTDMVLGNRAMVAIGVISYSLYLWHFPVLAFIRLRNLGELPGETTLPAVIGIFVLSVLTWRFVENPFRARTSNGWHHGLHPIAALWAGGLIVGASIFSLAGVPSRLNYPPGLEATFARSSRDAGCIDIPGADTKPADWYCELGPRKSGPVDAVVFGDSHAYSTFPVIRKIARDHSLRVVALADSGCIPLLGLAVIRPDQEETNCEMLNERVAGFVRIQQAPKVILVARWRYYTSLGQKISPSTNNDNDNVDPITNRVGLVENALRRTYRAYSASGAKVYLMLGVPEQRFEPREIYKVAYLVPGTAAFTIDSLSVSRSAYRLQRESFWTVLSATEAVLLNPTRYLCDDFTCAVGTSDASRYFDSDHLSAVGSLELYDMFDEALTRADTAVAEPAPL